MWQRLIVLVTLVIFLSGCATMGKKQEMEIQQLQSRVNSLEMELERKNQEIMSLEEDLEGLKATKSATRSVGGESTEVTPLSKKEVQKALKNAGYYDGNIDGKIGPKTKDAIIAFQKENYLKADGVVGRKTSSELRKYLNE